MIEEKLIDNLPLPIFTSDKIWYLLLPSSFMSFQVDCHCNKNYFAEIATTMKFYLCFLLRNETQPYMLGNHPLIAKKVVKIQ